jgi:HEAT repeat protein
VRGDVLDALGSWGTAESVPLLIKAIPVPETGDHAIRALGKLKDPRAITPLVAAVPNPFLRHEANVALKAFATAAEKPVLKLLDHRDRDVRFEACDILKVCGTPASIRALAKQAEDPDPGLSRAAKDAIQAINGRL